MSDRQREVMLNYSNLRGCDIRRMRAHLEEALKPETEIARCHLEFPCRFPANHSSKTRRHKSGRDSSGFRYFSTSAVTPSRAWNWIRSGRLAGLGIGITYLFRVDRSRSRCGWWRPGKGSAVILFDAAPSFRRRARIALPPTHGLARAIQPVPVANQRGATTHASSADTLDGSDWRAITLHGGFHVRGQSRWGV